MTTALIDGDAVIFRCAASVQEEDAQHIAVQRTNDLLQKIINEVQADSYRLFIKSDSNFRNTINPQYKANRRNQVIPIHLPACREFVINEWNAEFESGIEADDLLGINQTDETIICGIDKDLLMVPGNHYSWELVNPLWTRPASFKTVDYETGIKTFYKQMLIGDASDNIFGMKGIGVVKAGKLLDHLETEQEWFDVVYDLYDDADRFVMNAQCLWIMQNRNETWVEKQHDLILPDQCELAVAMTLESMKSLRDAISMEPSTAVT